MSHAYRTLVFVLDCSATMGRFQHNVDDGVFPPRDLSSLALGLEYIETKIRKAMMGGQLTARASIVLYGCETTDNWLASSGTDGYEGIVDLGKPDRASEQMVQRLRKFATVSQSTEADMLSALIFGLDRGRSALDNEGKSTRFVDLCVITDLEAAINWEDHDGVLARFRGAGKKADKEIALKMIVVGFGKDPDYAKPPKNEDGTRPESSMAKSHGKKENEKEVIQFVEKLNDIYTHTHALLGNARDVLAAARAPTPPTTESRPADYSFMIGDPADPLIEFEVQQFIEVSENKHKSMKKLSLLKRPTRPNAQIIPPPRKAWGRPPPATASGASGGASGLFGDDGGFGGGIFGSASLGGDQVDPLTAWFLRAGGGNTLGSGESQTQSLGSTRQTFDVEAQRQLFFVETVEEADVGEGQLRTAQDAQADDEREAALGDEEDEEEEEETGLERVPQSLQENLVTAYKLGKSYVSDVVKENFFLVGEEPGRIEVLHSIRVQKIKRYHLIGGTSLIFPNPSQPKSQVAMSAFVDAMAHSGRGLVVRVTKPKFFNGDPHVHLALLMPYRQVDDPDEPVVMGFRMSRLAFADDAKKYSGFRSFKNLFTVKGHKVEQSALMPSNKLTLDMDAFVQSWRLDRDDDGNEIELEDTSDNPLDLYNPSIRAVENAIMVRLADPTSDELPPPHHSILACIQPSERLLKRSREQYEELAREAGTTKVPPKTKRPKGQRTDIELIDDDEMHGLGGPVQRRDEQLDSDNHGVFESQFKVPAQKPPATTAPFSGAGNVLGNGNGGGGSKTAPMDVDGEDSDKTEDEDDDAPPPPPSRAPLQSGFAESQPSQQSLPRIKISSDFPVAEFEKAWHRAETVEQKNECWRAFSDAIVQMVAKSFAWSRYPLAIDALVFARNWAIANGFVDEYLALIQALRAEHHVDTPETQTRRMKKNNFWRWIVDSPAKLAPVTEEEHMNGEPAKAVAGLMTY